MYVSRRTSSAYRAVAGGRPVSVSPPSTPSTAIGDAGATLVALLEDALSDRLGSDQVVLGAPGAAPGKAPRLTLTLVDVRESPPLRNGQAGTPSGPAPLGPSALVLDLRYRLTVDPARGQERDPTAATRTQHELLGRAMRALHDRAVVDDPDLVGSLAGGPPLQVSLDQPAPPSAREGGREATPTVDYLVTPVVVDAGESGDGERATGRPERLPPVGRIVPTRAWPDPPTLDRGLRRRSPGSED